MTVGVMISGIGASYAGLFAALLAGHALHLALISYSLAGVCGALTFLGLAFQADVRG